MLVEYSVRRIQTTHYLQENIEKQFQFVFIVKVGYTSKYFIILGNICGGDVITSRHRNVPKFMSDLSLVKRFNAGMWRPDS